ncbi:Protein zds1 [Neolecta irregularis DAH-3]|uniref:Protein zds1 n=1 Tax=Neolecta irregularis (strain DAH-3) TaxID=1198029 RepID=A0A1U7LVQ9_NEOID|nr:Protein zds1 [Neolecta irregularis DAH-3]|eukprot:OLL26760.1 Protein zds1 [Neolecta irregularis DAH-3]
MTTSSCDHPQIPAIQIALPHVTEAIGLLYTADSSSSSSGCSNCCEPESSTTGTFPPDADPLCLEYSQIQTLRRLSMELVHSPDPDLPAALSSPDPSPLFWVPAHLHPTLSPAEFRAFIQSRLDDVQPCNESLSVPAGLGRRKSLLSREIENTDGSGAIGYSDKGSQLSRSSSIDRQHLATSDPDTIRSLAKVLATVPNHQNTHTVDNDDGPNDTPILVPLPGKSLRRSAKTFSRRTRGGKPLHRAQTLVIQSTPPDPIQSDPTTDGIPQSATALEENMPQHGRYSKSVETLATVEAIMAPPKRPPIRPRSTSDQAPVPTTHLPDQETPAKPTKKGWRLFANEKDRSKNRSKRDNIEDDHKSKEEPLSRKIPLTNIVSLKKEKEPSLFSSLFGSRQKAAVEKSFAVSPTARSSLSDDDTETQPLSHPPLVRHNFVRYSLHTERAIYRLSVVKISNPRRPLVQQVLLSNFMYGYLNLINESQPTGPGPGPSKNNCGHSRRHRSGSNATPPSHQPRPGFQFPSPDVSKTTHI